MSLLLLLLVSATVHYYETVVYGSAVENAMRLVTHACA
jgi:hypothetical protein